MFAMTAAHKTLPIPTYVRVTNLDNNRSVVVKVNDRGPFHDDRIIDLSYAAAIKLGFENTGPARVEVQAIDTGSAKPVTPATTSSQVAGPHYLQAGAFESLAAATELQQRLSKLTGKPVFVAAPGDREKIYRVRIGPLASLDEAHRLQNMVSDAKLGRPYLVVN
jgi:rare lipoprotein A